MKITIFATAAVLAAGVSGAAMAQYAPRVTYACPAGYTYDRGVCQPTPSYAPGYYSNPVSGAVNGEAAGAYNGYSAAGPVGAVVGGAVGAATGTLTGTANTVSGATTGCTVGYHWYNGYCYPNR